MKGTILLVVVAFLGLTGSARAHIGSSTVVFDGAAGPYPVRVIVAPPPVVPGRAEITVRLLEEKPEAVKITVLPVFWNAGLKGAPAPDEATPVAGDPALRQAELWLMTSGSYSVHVAVSGERGSGTAIVPVISVATRRLPMSTGLGVLLSCLGILLFAGAITLVGIGVRDSVTESDVARTARQKRIGRIASLLAFLIFGTALYAAKRWWDDEDRNYRNNRMYRPLPLEAVYRNSGAQPMIALEIPSQGATGFIGKTRLAFIPDHGKLMHLFLVREPELDALAHLHPRRTAANFFEVEAPPLPAGRYRLYADVTEENGFAETLTTTLELPAGATAADFASSSSRDVDDSWFAGIPAGNGEASGLLHRIGPAQIRVGEAVGLRFAARDEAGRALTLEPYMGMLGHAAIRRTDGTVFAHIHPTGTISMSAQMRFARAAARQTGQPEPMDHSMHEMHLENDGTVSFPYVFPQAGRYRIWVQTKIQGKVVTGVFDVDVSSNK